MGHRTGTARAPPGLGQCPVPGHCLKEGSRAALGITQTLQAAAPMPGRWAQGWGVLSEVWPCLAAPHNPQLSGSPSPARSFPLGVLPQPCPALSHRRSGRWGACAAAQSLVRLPSPRKEGPCPPKATQVAPARRQAALPWRQQQQIRFVCPAFAKQVLILLNKYEVMAAGLGAKRPGDILGKQAGSAVGQEQLGQWGWGQAELLAAGPAGHSQGWSQARCCSRCGSSRLPSEQFLNGC